MKYKLIEPAISQDIDVVTRVLTNRGIPLKDVEHYLHTCADDVIDPSGIARIKDGAQLLIQHLIHQDKIFILVDSDADGFTSAAILINYLNILFPGLTQNNIIYGYHEGKSHGLNDIIGWLITQNYKLVICPDSSSNDYEAHKQCKEHDIDVLVIDHHEAEEISPYACVINNQLCDYPTKSLSGAGMVYKFCCYLDELLEKSEAKNYIDLVALGLIADMMDIRDFETKELITEGLHHIRNPFFKEMVNSNKVMMDRAGGITPHTIGFYVAPFINATTRVGTLAEKQLLFESMLDFKAYELIPSTKRGCKGQQETRVEQSVRTVKSIKNRQTKITDGVYDYINKSGLLNTDNKILLIQLDPSYQVDKGIIGLVANKLANTYQQPTLVLTKQDDIWSGSGRGYGIEDFRGFLENTGLIEFAQGHQQAFGFAIKEDNIPQFIQVTNELLKDYDFSLDIDVDFIWNADDLNAFSILDIGAVNYLWGQNLNEPCIVVENVKVTPFNIQLLKESTIKITLSSGLNFIKFKTNEDEFNEICPDLESGRTILNILGQCAINEWGGNITPQILVKDWEIIEKVDYVF